MCEIVENAAEKIAERKVKEAQKETRVEDIKNIMNELKVSAERAMEILRIPLSEQATLKEMI